jgi:transcriptional regulator with XRE-family HTH domain
MAHTTAKKWEWGMHEIEKTVQTTSGEILIRLQDRNLLEVASVNPLNVCGTRVHVWVMLERIGGVWGVSGYDWPAVHLADPAGLRPAAAASDALERANEALTREALKHVVPPIASWAASHPEAFEDAAREAFRIDKKGLSQELATLRESLNCAAEAIDSLASEARPNDSLRLREHSRAMRGVAHTMPALHRLTSGVLYAGKRSAPSAETQHTGVATSPVLPAETSASKDLPSTTGGPNKLRGSKAVIRPRQELKDQTLGERLRQRREALGLTQQELALKLGIKPKYVADLENGPSRPSFMLLVRVADVLGLKKEDLFRLVQPDVRTGKCAEGQVGGAKSRDQVWRDFTSRKALLERHQVKPRELKMLSQVNLLGQISSPRQFLFILKAIRKARKTED